MLDSLMIFFILYTIHPLVTSVSASNANVTVNYYKAGPCNSTTTARVGDYCDHFLTIFVSLWNISNSSTDLNVEIILLDNGTPVMQMSKPSIVYVGRNFLNSGNLYQPTIMMTSKTNTSQFDSAVINFGTVVNSGLVAPNNGTENTIQMTFRTIIISNPSYQVTGAIYRATINVIFNNNSDMWTGQSLFNFSSVSINESNQFMIEPSNNFTLQVPQGSPISLLVPISFNSTYASNFVFTIKNNNPSQLGLCSAYVHNATNGFAHLTTLGYEISQTLTSLLTNNQISISLGQIVNTQSYSGVSSTLYIIVYGRVFKRDSVSSYVAGTMTAFVNATNSSTAQTFTIYALPTISINSFNDSIPTFYLVEPTMMIGIYQTLKMTVVMDVPSDFSAPVVIVLDDATNSSAPSLKACSVVFRSAGENVGSTDAQCADRNPSRFTYSSSGNSIINDILSYDYGVMSNTGSRSTIYSSTVNTVVFDAIFQVLDSAQDFVSGFVSVTLANDTLWIATISVNITTINYNITNSSQPDFYLSYETNNITDPTMTILGFTRLFYFDVYTKPIGIHAPMVLRIATNEILTGSGIPAASICLVKILYVGQNLPCLVPALYNHEQSPFITYSSRYNKRKNDTVLVQLGPLCNDQTIQSIDNWGQIRIGVYVKIESALGNGQSSYVDLNINYSFSNSWVGQILFTGNQTTHPPDVTGTPLFFPLNSSVQLFERNALTMVGYGLKIPAASFGTYSSLNSAIVNETNQQTSICRVDIAPNRGSNVPCSNDISSSFAYNSNGYASVVTTDLGMICSIASFDNFVSLNCSHIVIANTSIWNSSLVVDADSLIIRVFLLATSQTNSLFSLVLSNLIPSGQTPLNRLTSQFTSGSASNLYYIPSNNSINSVIYQQLNDSNNASFVFLGQDVLIRTQVILAYNLTSQSCYSVAFQFSFTSATIDAAYFTHAFLLSSGDNILCLKSKSPPKLYSTGSILYNDSMFFDLGTACYYPIDPLNITASTLTVQANARVPVTTAVPVNGSISINTVALININQTNLTTSIPLLVKHHTIFSSFTLSPNDPPMIVSPTANATVQCGVHETVTFQFVIYLPTYSQGRLQISIASTQLLNSITIDLVSANIVSAGTNVNSFMNEYTLGNKYKWTYQSSIPGSNYQDTAYLDLGVVTNTGISFLQNGTSNVSDNCIYVQANGYLTDHPLAETNFSFTLGLTALYGNTNLSNAYSVIVSRNGTERPVMTVAHANVTSGVYIMGSNYTGLITISHANNSNAECINTQLVLYLPTWISLQSYYSTISNTNHTIDSNSNDVFHLGTISFNSVASISFTLNIGTSNEMANVYQRCNSPSIAIPYELMCMKYPRADVTYYPVSKIFAFTDIISLPTSTLSVSNDGSLLDTLDPCQFSSSIVGSDASLVRTTGWQTGYRSNQWMLSGGTYVEIDFGNLTSIHQIILNVPTSFAPILFVQLGYGWDGTSFAMDPTKYFVNGSASYIFPLTKPILIQYFRVYLMDVVQPSDLLTRTSGFILNMTGAVKSANVSTTNICSTRSSRIQPRTVLVAPSAQVGLTYFNDVYVCDETTSRTLVLCHVLFNGITSSSATWMFLNTTVANIILFVYDVQQQMQCLYGYAQDGISIVRSDDRGVTWLVTDLNEYLNMITQCNTNTKICTMSDSYSLMSGSPGYLQMQGGLVSWTASIHGLWTEPSGGSLAFDWFGS